MGICSRYKNERFDSFMDVLRTFLREAGLEKPGDPENELERHLELAHGVRMDDLTSCTSRAVTESFHVQGRLY